MAKQTKSPGLSTKEIALLFFPYPKRKELYWTKDGQFFVDKKQALAHAQKAGKEMYVLKNPNIK